MISILTFTGASFLCGASVTKPILIVARILQGVGGGGMQPIAQAVLLETLPVGKRETTMAAYGMDVVVAPTIGPSLGGWITDNYAWRWIFYIDLPVGAIALFMVNLFVTDPPYIRPRRGSRIDYPGLAAMAVWLGALFSVAPEHPCPMLYQQAIRQATLLAYADNFRTMAGLALCCVPQEILFRRMRKPGGSVTPIE
jgi:MFS family permease